MPISVMRKIAFDTAHRLVGHEGKCRNLHGHRYVAELHAHASELDAVGRVIDFSVLKARVGGWVDQHWDHAAVLNKADRLVALVAQANLEKPSFLLDVNPTAEHLAQYLLTEVCPVVLNGLGVQVHKVVLHETPNCSATAELPRA